SEDPTYCDGRGGTRCRAGDAATTARQAGAQGAVGEGRRGAPAALARSADFGNRRGPLMSTAPRLDDNPCRPRHFKPPPPCARVVADERANQVLDTCRTRLVATAALFAVVFLVVVLRLAEVA